MELNNSNYFSKQAEKEYLGSTSFKRWIKCESKALAIYKGDYKEPINDAFLLGSYVHSWNEGKLEEFKINHPELFSSRGVTKGQLKNEYKIADKMIEILEHDDLVQKFRNGSEFEKIFVGKIDGVNFKICADIINLKHGYFADLKTTADLNKTYYNKNMRRHETFIQYYDYYLQLALYHEIIKQNTGLSLEPYIIAVDKTSIPDHVIIDMGKSFIEEKIDFIKYNLDRIEGLKEGIYDPEPCGHCDYCKQHKKAKIITLQEYEDRLL